MPKKIKKIKKKIKPKFQSFQDTILNLQKYWSKHGCVILQPYDLEVGAGTCLLYTSPSPRDRQKSRMPSSA